MYLRLVFIHLWLILSARAGLRSHVLGCGACGRVSVAGCERLAMGPVWGRVAGSAGQAGSTASAGWVGSTASVTGLVLVRHGRVVGALGRRRHLGGRADVVVSQGERPAAS